MMGKSGVFGLLFAILLFFMPMQAFAVDYTITDFYIEAHMLENGDVHVQELFTYSFSGKFNGITREIIPKEGSKIVDFEAFENGARLTVEKEDALYKIFRDGKDERIQIKLHYTIKDGVNKYADMAEFYWPFFDERNESTYGRVDIAIHPPTQTDHVIGFGYDTAYNKEEISSEGIVYFHLGEVAYGENGDIRVAFDAELFPALEQTSNDTIRETLIEEEQALIEKEKRYEQTKEKLKMIGSVSFPIIFIIIALYVLFIVVRNRRKKQEIHKEIVARGFVVPKQKLSVPATLYMMEGFSPEGMAATLLELVRKGYVKQRSADEFLLVNRQVDLTHEEIFIEWLFDEVGKDGVFRSEYLEQYIRNSKNQRRYGSMLQQWRNAVKEEVNQYGVRERRTAIDLLVGLISFTLIPLAILFLMFDLYFLTFLSLILIISGIVVVLYTPYSSRGFMIKYEWQYFWTEFEKMADNEWKRWSKDEQIRVYIYGVGTKRNKGPLNKYFKELVKRGTTMTDHGAASYYYFYDPSFSASFVKVDNIYSEAQSSSSSSSYSGGGTGGGGGGSGAF